METNFLDWISKAENDWKAVQILKASRKAPHDVVLFHCHQAAEKYLKAILIRQRVEIIKTHDLMILYETLIRKEPSLKLLKSDFVFLNDFGVLPRYPDDLFSFTKEDVVIAITSAKRIRFYCRKVLGVAIRKQK